MRKVISFLLAIAGASFGALSPCTTTWANINDETTPKVVHVDVNFTDLKDCDNENRDTLNNILSAIGGTTGATGLSSTGNIKANIDRDSNTTGARFWVANHTADTLFRVADDSSAKFTGAVGIAGRTTLSDSLIAISARWTGNIAAVNGSLSGTLGVTGVATLTAAPVLSALTASLPVFTNGSKALASNAMTGTGSVVMSASPTLTGTLAAANGTYSGTLGVTGAFTGTSGAFSTTLGVTGLQSNAEALAFTANGTAGTGRIYKSAGSGLTMRGVTGSSNDFGIESAAGSNILINPTGTTSVTFPGTNVTISGTATTTGVHTFTSAPVFTAATASQALFTNGSKALVSNAITGTGNVVMSASPTFTGTIAAASQTLSGSLTIGTTATTTGVHTFTAAPVFSSATASQILSVDASKNLTSTATTGSGSVMLAASPSITSPTVATSLTASYATASTAAEFDGSKNLVSVAKTGTGSDAYSASPTFTGTVGAAAITATGTVTADTIVSSKFYTEGTFTGTITGCTTSPTGTVYYTRVGKQVNIYVPAITGTSNSTALTLTGLPAAIYPARNIYGMACELTNSSSAIEGSCDISTAGVVTAWPNGSAGSYITVGNFGSSGTKGFGGASLTYTLQ